MIKLSINLVFSGSKITSIYNFKEEFAFILYQFICFEQINEKGSKNTSKFTSMVIIL